MTNPSAGSEAESYQLADDTKLVSKYNRMTDRADSRLATLLSAEPAISLHDHPFRYPDPFTTESWARARLEQRLTLGYTGLASSGLAATVGSINSWCSRKEALMILARLQVDVRRNDGFYIAESGSHIQENFLEGELARRVGIIMGLESLTAFSDDISSLDLLFGLGVRVAGFLYDEGSLLGCGLKQSEDSGLTRQGRDYVKAMNELGILVDLAHVGDRTTLDVIELSSAPVVISHSGARGLWPSPRMKPDVVLRALAEKGGVIGVSAAPNTTCSPNHNVHNLDAVMDHTEYLIELVGADHVGFGPDLLFGSHAGLHRVRSISYEAGGNQGPIAKVDYVDGLENPNEAFWNIASWLDVHQYDRDVILQLMGRNAMRVLTDVLG